MIEFFKWFADLLAESLAYLELDEDYTFDEIHEVEIELLHHGQCMVTFPEIEVEYFASSWTHMSGKNPDWLFVR
jgi:hypothetical protein